MISDPHTEIHLEIKGRKVPVWIYGNIKKYPVIFIHGYFRGFSDYVGDLPMRYLNKDYCIYAFDLPGYGKSKNVAIDTALFVEEIIIKLIKNRHFTVFGSSYGGIVALRYALTFPKNLDALIIAGTPFGGKFSLLNFAWTPTWINPVLSRFISDSKIMKKKNLAQIKVPALLFYGEDDKRATLEMGRNLANSIKNSKLISYRRTHGWLLHRIDESGLLREIKSFLKPFTKQ